MSNSYELELTAKWQKIWRQAMGLETKDPVIYYQDSDLYHGVLFLREKNKLEECFSIFPRGNLVYERLILASQLTVNDIQSAQDIPDETLLQQLKQIDLNICAVLKQFGDQKILDDHKEYLSHEKTKVYRGDENLPIDFWERSDQVGVILNDNLDRIIEHYHGRDAALAYYFLVEPLYMNFYDYAVVRWILWAMVADEFDIDPYQIQNEFVKIRAKAGINDEEMYVYVDERSMAPSP